jgi:hypothetical protein
MPESLENQIERAAQETVRYLRRDCGGAFFATDREWLRHAHSHGVTPVPVAGARDFTALAHPYAEGRWFLLYNSARSPRQVIGYVVHELAEIVAATSDRCLWEEWPVQPSYHYTGGQSPEDIRHRAARLVEQLVLDEIDQSMDQQAEYPLLSQ